MALRVENFRAPAFTGGLFDRRFAKHLVPCLIGREHDGAPIL
jgi:hypothetical protein